MLFLVAKPEFVGLEVDPIEAKEKTLIVNYSKEESIIADVSDKQYGITNQE